MAERFGVHVSETAVCPGHSAPLDILDSWCYDRPSLSLAHGPRGGGKSFMAAFATHWNSIGRRGHGTRVLGGSLAQSEQIYDALRSFEKADPTVFRSVTRTRAEYVTDSDVSILAASRTSVRGPHVPSLLLDEVDEIEPDIRESAMGMCMRINGLPASVTMASTWHRMGGPMEGLIEGGRAGEFPFHAFCAFEVLERCPEDRSGPDLEKCPDCPIQRWCHDVAPGQAPKAKRSNGHYAIESLIQKVHTVSLRVFEADYLCLGPKADGLWFPRFDATHEGRHVTEAAEYDPINPYVYAAVDNNSVVVGGVLFQVRTGPQGLPVANVFADYLSEGLTAEANARALLELARQRCNGKLSVRYADPAGGSRNAVGPIISAEYARCGFPVNDWPSFPGSVAQGLSLIDGMLSPAVGPPRLTIHPRCRHLIAGFQGYQRARSGGQWLDHPKAVQHPFEDVMDALRGGLHARLGGITGDLFIRDRPKTAI